VAAEHQQGQRVVLARRWLAVRGGRQQLVGGVREAASSSRCLLASSLRSWSVILRDATVISQPVGLSGTRVRPLGRGREQRLLHASSAASKFP